MSSVASSFAVVPDVAARDPRRPTWTHAVWAAVAGAAFAAVGSNALWDLVQIGVRDEESSHVWLVPLVVLALVWVRRGRLAKCSADGRWLGAACVGLGWAAWSIGYGQQMQVVWHGGVVLMVVGGVLTALGRDVFLKFLPAFTALVFILPVPGRARLYIAEPLQRATAIATQAVSETFGIEMSRFGSLLTVNGNEVAIAEACNGMRMVFTLLMACYLYAFVTPLRTWVRALILMLSPLVAVVCNVTRLVPTVWMYGHGSAEAAELFHDVSGWVMLVLAFLMLMATTNVLAWAGVPVEAGDDSTEAEGKTA